MSLYQPAIMDAVPQAARHVLFNLNPACTSDTLLLALQNLRESARMETMVIGIGLPLAQALKKSVPGLHAFPAYDAAAVSIPSTPTALWCWLHGTDRGTLLHRARHLEKQLAPAFVSIQNIEAFRYENSLDLTGYEDGTENPQADAAIKVAFASGQGKGVDGSSIAALQQWIHRLDTFDNMSSQEQDHVIGRHKIGNEEIDDAPESAHVKRTAQESFTPEAFVLRRSMPWSDCGESGLMFLAFGHNSDAFDVLLKRMTGQEDGIVDALFRFTRPVTGAYFWCPPMTAGQLDLSLLGL